MEVGEWGEEVIPYCTIIHHSSTTQKCNNQIVGNSEIACHPGGCVALRMVQCWGEEQ